MKQMIKNIHEIGILPVIVVDEREDALPLAKALIKGGLPCAEVTFRTSIAAEVIHSMRTSYPEMLVGAGTILSVEQLKEAILAGAQFIISPGYDEHVVTYCIEHDIPVIPGIATPSELQKAFCAGIDVVKFFPAEAAGGLAMIKGMSAPYGMMKFIPTGGINEQNMKDYLSCDKILAIGGSWMVDSTYIKEKAFDKITELTKQAVIQLHEVR